MRGLRAEPASDGSMNHGVGGLEFEDVERWCRASEIRNKTPECCRKLDLSNVCLEHDANADIFSQLQLHQ